MSRLALFDLDHTLLSGDSDVLWCDLLIEAGVLSQREFEPRNRALAERYAAGLATPAEFCGFYAQTLAGSSPARWQPLRERFFATAIRPRIPAAARRLVELHRDRGDTLVLTTATNRYLTEPTAADLGIEVLIATELEVDGAVFTGRIAGLPNMRDGKLVRLREWLAEQRLDEDHALAGATFYSDSTNDLPLLQAVGHPIVVDPDASLAALARERGWPVLRLER